MGKAQRCSEPKPCDDDTPQSPERAIKTKRSRSSSHRNDRASKSSENPPCGDSHPVFAKRADSESRSSRKLPEGKSDKSSCRRYRPESRESGGPRPDLPKATGTKSTGAGVEMSKSSSTTLQQASRSLENLDMSTFLIRRAVSPDQEVCQYAQFFSFLEIYQILRLLFSVKPGFLLQQVLGPGPDTFTDYPGYPALGCLNQNICQCSQTII